MKRKEVNRARREWDVLQRNLHDSREVANWARRWGPALLDETKRLRLDLRSRLPDHVKLELRNDDLDNLIDEIEKVIDWLPADALASVDACLVLQRLHQILDPFMADHDDGDE